MSLFYHELSIKGKGNKRIPVTDCRLEPLNLLIPGNAPILVPKHKARSGSSKKHTASNNIKIDVAIPNDEISPGYDADRDEEEQEQEEEDDTIPLIKKGEGSSSSAKKQQSYDPVCKKDSYVRDKAVEARHRRRAERQRDKAEREQARLEEDQRKLQERIAQQEAYILRLKSKYEARFKDKKPSSTDNTDAGDLATETGEAAVATTTTPTIITTTATTTTDTTTATTTTDEGDASDGATTDGSAKVREMIKNMKIKAAGTNHGNSFTPSEDAQLLARKKANESWKEIVAAMGRPKKELQHRFKELQESGAKIPGEDDTDDATGPTSNNTTAAATTAGETTDTEKTDGNEDDKQQKKDADDAGIFDSSALFGALEAIAEGAAEKKKSPDKTASPTKPDSNESDKNDMNAKTERKHTRFGDPDSNNDDKEKGKNLLPPARPEGVKGDSGYEASASELVDDEVGTKAYIAQYARKLLNDANAGRIRIPDPDDKL